MVKKNFKDNNPALAFINIQEEPEEQQEQNTQEEQKEYKGQREPNTPMAHVTQGKKGQKYPRINMAFTPNNLEYLKLISRIEGVSMTEYVNILIEADKEIKKGVVEEAKKILKGAK